ncbi:hypothetical protein [Promicromonospora iranensis]|uniref:Uncharacterized protein n=1 Tax=Promicromonospora iranensis TaxID=1105144 RepID=A0ABU2CTJ3_9MICO|nr:hypothetical protein [Promicromonospora iranensis]MDR7384645.1 hypothetical protein [Promicromonospora iranensis]
MEATELARPQFALLAVVHFLFVLLLRDDDAGPDVLLRFGAATARRHDGGGLVGVPDDRPEPEVAR